MELQESDVETWICDTSTDDDYEGGSRDRNAARGVMGCGTFNNRDIEWNVAVVPDTVWEYCLWSLPAASIFDETSVIIDACLSFPVEE